MTSLCRWAANAVADTLLAVASVGQNRFISNWKRGRVFPVSELTIAHIEKAATRLCGAASPLKATEHVAGFMAIANRF